MIPRPELFKAVKQDLKIQNLQPKYLTPGEGGNINVQIGGKIGG